MSATIACVGWGSLIWRSGRLPLDARWRRDGPSLPVEFARESGDGRVTLVAVPGAVGSRTLWAPLDVEGLGEARRALRRRERSSPGTIGRWPAPDGSEPVGRDAVARWAAERGLDGVVWTALPPRFGREAGRVPGLREVLDHLAGLRGASRARAERYVRRAPRQIRTPYRRAIERRLGWTPRGSPRMRSPGGEARFRPAAPPRGTGNDGRVGSEESAGLQGRES